MRLLTLLLGLAVAGLLIVLPQQFNVNILPAFVKLWPNTEGQRQLANIIFFAVPVTAIAGGLLALFVPGISALLLLLAGLGWFGILLSIPRGLSVMGAAPGAVAVLGAITAYLAAEIAASRRRESLREERATRRGRRVRDYADDEDDDVEDDVAPPRQLEPKLEPALRAPGRAEPVVERSSRPQRPRYEIPLTLEDSARDEDDEIEVVPQRRAAVESPVPSRSSAAQKRRQPERAAARVAAPDRGVRERLDSDDEYDEDGRPLSRRSFPWAAVMGVLAVLLLAAGGGYFLLDRQSGSGAATGTAALSTGTGALSTGTGAASATTGTSSGPTMVAAGQTYADPFAYCEAVGTVDYVDGRYTGSMVTPEIAQALRMPLDSSRDRVVWRCVSGQVLGCSSFAWPRCGVVPTAKELVEFCRIFPDVPRLIAPQGPWSCVAGKPKLPDDATWPVDARGFAVGAWINISASAAQPGATPITNAPVSTLPQPTDGTTVLQ